MDAGAQFPPIVCFSIDGQLLLADGWHRLEAWKRLGAGEVEVDIREGGATRRCCSVANTMTNTAPASPPPTSGAPSCCTSTIRASASGRTGKLPGAWASITS